jgi:predicted NBD/HSP70 family sugar kinase
MQIGIDLGGTKIEGIALAKDRVVVPGRRVVTPRDYEGTLDAIARLVAEIEAQAGRTGTVGVGIPGVVSRANGLVKNANSVWLNGRPILADLEARLARPVRVANDANCFALSEAVDGAGQGAHVVFGVILGTGVGGGIVVDGRVLTGANAVAGEWGHNPLLPVDRDHPLPLCYCGRRGCIETYLSGPGLSADHAAANGERRDAAEIARRAEGGEAACIGSLERYELRLARALASVINVIDPDVIVLGGGLSNIARLYTNVPRLWDEHVFSDEVRTRLVPARHGDSSGVRGAAWLWDEGDL